MSALQLLEFPGDVRHIPDDWCILKVDGAIIQPTRMPGPLFRGVVGWLLAQLRQGAWTTVSGEIQDPFPVCLSLTGIYLETCLADQRWASSGIFVGSHQYDGMLMVCLGYATDRKPLTEISKKISNLCNYAQSTALIDVECIRDLAAHYKVGHLWGSSRKSTHAAAEPESPIGMFSYAAYCATAEAILYLLFRISRGLSLEVPSVSVEGTWLQHNFTSFDPSRDAESTLLLLSSPVYEPDHSTEQRLQAILDWFCNVGSLDSFVRLYLSALFGNLDSITCLRHLAEMYLRYRENGAQGTLTDADIGKRIVKLWNR